MHTIKPLTTRGAGIIARLATHLATCNRAGFSIPGQSPVSIERDGGEIVLTQGANSPQFRFVEYRGCLYPTYWRSDYHGAESRAIAVNIDGTGAILDAKRQNTIAATAELWLAGIERAGIANAERAIA